MKSSIKQIIFKRNKKLNLEFWIVFLYTQYLYMLKLWMNEINRILIDNENDNYLDSKDAKSHIGLLL